MYYFKYLPNSKQYKVELCKAKTKDEVFEILNNYFEKECK